MNPEEKFTISCVEYYKLKYPNGFIFHIANERKTSRIRGGILKRMGVTAGVSDLFIPVLRRAYGGMFVELKREKFTAKGPKRVGEPSKEQLEFLVDMHRRGYAVAVAWNIDEFMNHVDRYMSGDSVECEYLKEYL